MDVRSLVLCGVFLLCASLVYGAGSYQRTRDGQTLVWRDVPERGDEAKWSGKRDQDGFATGRGILTWYKVEPITVTGSHIPNARGSAVVVSHYSGTMVKGKFKGAVSYIETNKKGLQPTFVTKADRASRRVKATRARTARARVSATAEQTPTPSSQQIIIDTPELTSATAAPTQSPEQNPSPIVEEPDTAAMAATQMATPPEPAPEQSPPPNPQQGQITVASETATLASKRMAVPPSEQEPRRPDARSASGSTRTGSDHPLRSLSSPPTDLPKPPRTIDEQTVARLDALYHSAVKANDAAIMDEILADDFILVTNYGASLTKPDLIKEAQEKRTMYEHQEVEEGTQKVRIWRDTAVVTARLRVKGTRDQNPFDYKLWLSETYVRTPTGWRYVFGQALQPDTE